MPKLSSATPRWAKLTRRWPEGGSSSVMLGLPWNSSAITAVLRQLLEIRERMEQAGLSLSEAAELQAAAEACSTTGPVADSGPRPRRRLPAATGPRGHRHGECRFHLPGAAAGERLTVYSLRHGFALRAHEVAELSPRVTAAMSRARQRGEQRQQEHQRNVA